MKLRAVNREGRSWNQVGPVPKAGEDPYRLAEEIRELTAQIPRVAAQPIKTLYRRMYGR